LYNLADYLKPWNFDFTVNTEAQPYLPLTPPLPATTAWDSVQLLMHTPNCATYPCSDVAGCCTTYLDLIGEKTVLQQSWLAWWYCSLSSDPSSCGDTPETYFLQDGGIYDIYWAVLDKDNGKTIGKVQNRVYVINTTAIA
jgi:hypothetical protein